MILQSPLYLEDSNYLRRISMELKSSSVSALQYIHTTDYYVFRHMNGRPVRLYKEDQLTNIPMDSYETNAEKLRVPIKLRYVKNLVANNQESFAVVYMPTADYGAIQGIMEDSVSARFFAAHLCLALMRDTDTPETMERRIVTGIDIAYPGKDPIVANFRDPFTFPSRIDYRDVTSQEGIKRLMDDSVADRIYVVNQLGEIVKAAVSERPSWPGLGYSGVIEIYRDMGY